MAGPDRELVLYLRSPDSGHWDDFLDEEGHGDWDELMRSYGFDDGQYSVKDLDSYGDDLEELDGAQRLEERGLKRGAEIVLL